MSRLTRTSRISSSVLVLLLIVSVCGPSRATTADELTEMLARAVALYYEADFAKSIELLLRVDEMLRQKSGQPRDRADVKMQLALGYIGLNDNTRAKAYFEELFALEPDRQTDPQMFSPKVVQLADEAKAAQSEQRCRSILDEAERLLGSGNSEAVVNVIGTNQAKCAGLASLYPRTAELFFKEGLDAYRSSRTETALQKFRAALRFAPKHELAAQYVDLAQSKLEVAADRALLAWRKDFNAGDFASAARDYRELTSLSKPETMEEIHRDYRQALSNLVDSWNRACASDDAAAMESVRLQVNALLPEPSFGEDILARMKMCAPTGCIQMNTQLALARLKTRIDPQFSVYELAQLRSTGLTVRVKARINDKGDATAGEITGGNPLLYRAVRAAFDQWKFSAAIVQGQARCVDTEIPIVINFTQN